MRRIATTLVSILVMSGCQAAPGSPGTFTQLGAVRPTPPLSPVQTWSLGEMGTIEVYDVTIQAGWQESLFQNNPGLFSWVQPQPNSQPAVFSPIVNQQRQAGEAYASWLNSEANNLNEVSFALPSNGNIGDFAKQIAAGKAVDGLALTVKQQSGWLPAGTNQAAGLLPDFATVMYGFVQPKPKRVRLAPSKVGAGLWEYRTYAFRALEATGTLPPIPTPTPTPSPSSPVTPWWALPQPSAEPASQSQ